MSHGIDDFDGMDALIREGEDGISNHTPYSIARHTSWRLMLLLAVVWALQGCTTPAAPSPTPNPHPHQNLKLKIAVEKNSEVNRVEVLTSWVVTNLSCAPIGYPAGNRVVKQVDVPEQVEKMGDTYVATLVEDRFLPDKCHWAGGGGRREFFP